MKIILPVLCSLLLIGCSDSTPDQTPPPPTVVAEPNSSLPVQEVSAAETAPAVSSTVAAAPAVAEKAVTPEPAAKKEAAPSAVAKQPVAPAAVDAGTLFGQKCASCHGAKGEKAALGKSAIIADFSEQQVKEALKGYQAGTYGKEMKALMQGQAKGLNDAQIDALAKHIPAL